jgi:hypothetical protein
MSESLNDSLERFFRANPNTWIDGKALAELFGGYGWRSRVSDVRRRGLTVENRQRREWNFSRGERYTISEYRYVPDLPVRLEASGQQVFI